MAFYWFCSLPAKSTHPDHLKPELTDHCFVFKDDSLPCCLGTYIGFWGGQIETDKGGQVLRFLHLFPNRTLNPKTIRQSVIANWLNEKRYPLEQVQRMAGHRWPSTTETYLRKDPEGRRKMVHAVHPLG